MLGVVLKRFNKKDSGRKVELTEIQETYNSLVEQLSQAKKELHEAERVFNEAEPVFMGKEEKSSYIDVAVLNLQVAEQRYCLLLKELKLLQNEIKLSENRLAN